MMLVWRVNLAEDELISTWNSWMLSRPGGRVHGAAAVQLVGQGGAVENDVVRPHAGAEGAQVAIAIEGDARHGVHAGS